MRAALAALAAAALLLPAAGGAQAAPAGPVVFADGHVDLAPRLVDGQWRLQARRDEGGAAAWHPLAGAVLTVPDSAKITTPGGQLSLLGPAGATAYLLPQTQARGVVWPGWTTEEVSGQIRGPVDWVFEEVTGPGRFALFTSDAFGRPTVLVDPDRPLPQTVRVPQATHAHANWAFTAPGGYRIRMSMAAGLTSGARVRDEQTLAVAVGDGVDPAAVTAPAPPDRTPEPAGGAFAVWLGVAVAAIALGALLIVLVRRRKRC
ncbi:hypothetical protein GCM10010124_38710 [Pilimelia terevasa]|uniref:Uncharacterized protein n=2 Tax=Pilimelia terevasa TaxID=53372 RepID=A0A8J3FK29_9ACTN|nr:hypothetical protein GCM10010124_38710 [Pilimelia terevasa]